MNSQSKSTVNSRSNLTFEFDSMMEERRDGGTAIISVTSYFNVKEFLMKFPIPTSATKQLADRHFHDFEHYNFFLID